MGVVEVMAAVKSGCSLVGLDISWGRLGSGMGRRVVFGCRSCATYNRRVNEEKQKKVERILWGIDEVRKVLEVRKFERE